MTGPKVTGVGSLPHRDPIEAATFVLETTDVPYLPQLPNRHPEEGMLRQWGDGLAELGASPGALGLAHGEPQGPREEAFGGAEALVELLDPGTPLLKTQATGPITLGAAALAAGHPGRSLWDDLVPGLVERIEAHVTRLEERIPSTEILLLLDEPALAGLRSGLVPPGEAEEVLRITLDAISIPVGLHCCGDTDWALVAGLRPDWISWDLAALGPELPEMAEPLAEAIVQGTGIIWGVVPSQPGPVVSDEELLARLRRVEEALVVGGADLERLWSGSLLTPGCGLAGMTADQAEQVASRVRALSKELALHG